MSYLPVDVLTEILLKLPAKSLLRFKSVSKLWYDIISDYDFMNRHVEQSDMHIIMRTPTVYMCDFDTFDNPRNLNYPCKNWEDGGLYIVGSCRGLLCFSVRFYPFTTFLYNPTTQTHKTLPYLPLMSTFYHPKGKKYLGFGYDHLSKDYKCVSIDLSQSGDGISFKSQVMVYSLRDDTWKRGAHAVPYYFNGPLNDFNYPVFLNGIVHWTDEGNLIDPLPMVGFNLSDETFSSVALPNFDTKGIYKRAYIGLADGCLCFILNYNHYSNVWIMKEYGIATSWTRMCRIVKRNIYENLNPISFSKSRNELLVILSLLDVAYLDLETLQIINVQLPAFKRLHSVCTCLENLLVFKDGENIPLGRHQVRNRNMELRKLLMRRTERLIKHRATSRRAKLEMFCSFIEEVSS